MRTFDKFVRDRMAKSNYSFSIKEASQQPFKSYNAFKSGVYKLKKKGDVISPRKGLYIIVPSEYRSLGSLPPEDLVPILHKGLVGIKYYACLLSAAFYHGASHQKPQVFQIMSDKRLAPIRIGKVSIEFIYKKSFENLPLKKIPVNTGYLEISSPEVTAMDLLLYPHHAGGLDHIATVLSELVEAIDLKKMIELIDIVSEKFWIQRLGYILEHIEPEDAKKRDELVDAIYEKIKKQIVYPVPLLPGLPIKGFSRNNRWRVIENTSIESDI
jgi:predicted transcriptional regulator of viral defense system